MHLLAAAFVDALDHAIRTWGAEHDWPIEQVLRLLLAAVCGSLVGIEREIRGRQAGFRTNLLVCVGSALVMIVSVEFTSRTWQRLGDYNIGVDPGRIAYGVMTGIGFLGAGTIIQQGGTVRGLTTAASLWCVAGVGLAAGFGMYSITVIATLMIVGALWILGYIDSTLPFPKFRTLTIRRAWGPGAVEQTVKRIESAGLRCMTVNFDRTANPEQVDVKVEVSFRDRKIYSALAKSLEQDSDYQFLASHED